MTTNDDLDDFFKKKDRKSNKHKKQTGLLTNNEKLLEQLVIVTSATSAFKENLTFDDDDDDDHLQQTVNDETIVGTSLQSELSRHSKIKTSDDNNRNPNGQLKNYFDDGNSNQGQDEWEEFDSLNNAKYEQLRLKFTGRNNNDDNDVYDDDDDDNNRLNRNDDNHDGNLDREQVKEKPVWNIRQVNQTNETIAATNSIVEEKLEEPTSKSTTSAGVYRPPQLRTGGQGVTVVSGIHQKSNKKKEQPNLASTDEFPTLKPTVNKK